MSKLRYRPVYTTTVLHRLLICLALNLPLLGFAATYAIIDLGSDAWSYSWAHGINDQGHIVIEYEPNAQPTVLSLLYDNGGTTNVGNFSYTVARSVNDSDVVAGELELGIETHGFSYSDGVTTDLGSKAGLTGYSTVFSVNRADRIAGESSFSFMDPGTIYAMTYSGGTWTSLGALDGNYSAAFGINNSNVVVGETDIIQASVTNVVAFVYTNSMASLGMLPGGDYSSANAVNDAGVVVGQSDILVSGNLDTHAFVCDKGPGSMRDLGTLGGNYSDAKAINNLGQIVGWANDSNQTLRAFLSDGTNMVSLLDLIPPDSGWTNLESADGINNSGQIVGYGFLTNGAFHAYLLTPLGPLTVSITNPVAHTTFQAPASFVIGASASDTEGTVTNVQFFINGVSVGNSTSAPYSAMANNLNAGPYTLTATASDDGGRKATSSIGVTVTNPAPGSITLSDVVFTNTSLSFSFGTQTGLTYYAEFTTPLAATNTWLTFTNLTGDGSTVRVTDSTATNSQRYYRVYAQ